MPPVVSSAEILKLELTAAPALGVTSNVAVDSASSEIGPIAFADGSTSQPGGTFSSTLPAGSSPDPDRTCTVAWNVSSAVL